MIMRMMSAPRRFDLGLSLGLTIALGLLAGCGGQEESVDTATTTVTEPGTATAPAATGTGAEATPTTTATDTSKPADATPVVKAEGFGTLKGRVIFGGEPPAAKILVKKGDMGVKDAAVCANEDIPSQRLVVDPATKGVRYAIVYIPRPTATKPEAASAAASAKVEFDQKGCVFEPHVLCVMKGATVELKSSDPVGHNVNSRLVGTKFNLTLQPGGPPQPMPVKAAETRPGEVVCDIHPWMKSWWMVTNSPYFAVTDEQGNYEIKDAPAGTQKVVVWQEAVQGFVTASSGDPVEIQADSETVKDFTIDPAKVRPEA